MTRADDDPVPDELHRLALRFAVDAAAEVRRTVEVADGSDAAAGPVATKSTPTDLVTATDRAIEQRLVSQILGRRPGDAILGEESGERRAGGARVRWVLDPIDGTVNFVLGLPQYAVSVAAELDGEVVAGAVANPASGEVFHAVRGGGAWLRRDGVLDPDRPDVVLRGPRAVSLDRAVVATGFGYDVTQRARQAAVVAQLLARVGDVRRLGAAALDLCFVAAGRLDAYFEAGLHAWDHAAGGLIAQEAGCVVAGLDGRPAGDRMLVSAGPGLIDDLTALLGELGADAVLVED